MSGRNTEAVGYQVATVTHYFYRALSHLSDRWLSTKCFAVQSALKSLGD